MNNPIPIFEQEESRGTVLSRLIRTFCALCSIIILIVVGGFLYFLTSIPPAADISKISQHPAADAIVVLTGGRDRITMAMQLLEEGTGARLLISGVNEDISRDDLAQRFGGDGSKFDCCVDLGFEARSTIGNADETADWTKTHSYASLIVVTSDYHMPRSLVLLQNRMPDTALVPFSVASAGSSANSNGIWSHIKLARIVVSEYAKYVITLLYQRLG